MLYSTLAHSITILYFSIFSSTALAPIPMSSFPNHYKPFMQGVRCAKVARVGGEGLKKDWLGSILLLFLVSNDSESLKLLPNPCGFPTPLLSGPAFPASMVGQAKLCQEECH